MAKIINCTPHDVVVFSEGREVNRYFPSGIVARVRQTVELSERDFPVPLYRKTLEDIENLPKKEEGTYYIVSLPVAQAAQTALDRRDLLVPGDLIRNEEGQPIGCNGLAYLN